MSSQAQPKALQQTPIAGWSAVRLLRFTPVGLLLPLAIIALLELSVSRGWVPAWLMPAPSDLLMTFRELAGGPLWTHISASSQRVLLGFGIGAGLAVLIGTLVGMSRQLEAWLDPTFQALRAVPGLGAPAADLAGYRRGVQGDHDRHRLLLPGVHEHGRRRAQR